MRVLCSLHVKSFLRMGMERSLLHQRLCCFLGLAMTLSLASVAAVESIERTAISNRRMLLPKAVYTRKLLQSTDDNVDSNRIGELCTKDDIVIYQGSTIPLPNGIPAYTVQIMNTCVSGCSISNIHVSCGSFVSVCLVNPRVFRKDFYNDCVVNDGQALGPGQTLSFQYANSVQYPLSVSYVSC